MSKSTADDAKKISTSFLKKHGYFKGWRSGTITWTRWENKSSVGVEVSTLEGDGYLRITYTQTDRDTQEKKDFDFKIPLTTTPCRFGGKRYWFICPWYKSGVYCGKRVGTLYKDGDYFACRHCYDLTYESRNLSGYAKPFGAVISFPELEELEAQVKRKYYRGQPTKRYLRFLKKENKANRSMIGIVGALEMRAKKVSGKFYNAKR